MSLAGRILLVCITISAVGPAAAQAAQRFVTPAGSGVICSAAVPCGIVTGVNSAASNDEVIVGPGTYTLSAGLVSAAGLNVHGQAGQPRPVISSSAGTALNLSGAPSRAADLEIEHTGTFVGLYASATGSTVDRVVVRSSGFDTCVVGPSARMRDSLCVSTATGGRAFGLDFAGSGGSSLLKLRNLTAIATGANSVGIRASVSGNTSFTVDAREVIAQGSADDVRAETSGFTTTVQITMRHSNYDDVSSPAGAASVTAPGSGTNQTAAPIFNGSSLYRQAATSPTVDAGATDAETGAIDLDGDPRALGSANDIGADELVPAVPPAVDSLAPETTIFKGPKKKSKSRKAKFFFQSSEAGSSFECRLDRKPFAPCSSPLKRRKLKRRKHAFSVRATDAAGNVDATPAKYRWKVKKKKTRA